MGSDVLIDAKEKMHDVLNNTAIIDVSSSSKCVSISLAMCNDVIINRQKPKRLADVLKICCDVLFAIPKNSVNWQRI